MKELKEAVPLATSLSPGRDDVSLLPKRVDIVWYVSR